MNKCSISLISILLLTLLIGVFLASCGTSKTTPTASSGGSLDGQTLMQERCSVCHSTERITTAHMTADEWTSTVQRMISHGAQLNAQEEQTLIDYLAANYK
jgi:Quinohemoprotein amine dehydrogenase A, alpha subunit, haem binding